MIKYTRPEIEMTTVETEDIILVSGGENSGGGEAGRLPEVDL